MKVIARRIKYILPLFVLILFVGAVFGYDNLITHPQISAAATNIYQSYTGKTLSQEQTAWIILGSVDEDAFPRYLNHYYDPTTGSGLNDIDERFGQVNGMSAKEWAQTQSGWTAHAGDYSEPAILENYRNSNKERAYQGVGHVLHLIQDMSVPAHTRNDSHSQGDPYENWAKQNGKVDFGKIGFISIQNLDQAFDELALYSHNNFFSEDTITDIDKFKTKTIFNDGKYRTYLINNINGVEYYLAFSDNPTSIKPLYEINDPEIHSDYWNLLHLKAIGYSAGVIDYFAKQFEAIDAEKQTKKLSFFANIINSFSVGLSNAKSNAGYMWGDIVMITSTPLSDAAMALMDAYDSATSLFASYADLFSAQLSGLINTNAQPEGQKTAQAILQPLPEPALQPVIVQPQPEIVPADPTAYEVPVVPVVQELSAQDVPQDVAQDILVNPPVILPVEVVEIPASDFPTSDVGNNATTTAIVVDTSYHGSASVTGVSPDAVVVVPPAEEPPISFSETSTTTDATATSTDSTATSTEPVIVAESEIIDGAPVVINEIAWMGTKAQANDEWIELYNKTNSDIDLSDWMLESRNKVFSIPLSKTIPAKGYFLLERTASTTTDQPENIVYSSYKGVLVDSGPEANLYLKNGTTTVDYIDFGSWPFANKKEERRSLERVSPYATSTNSYNWKTYSEALAPPFAKDAKGGDILGTPGAKNSVAGYYTPAGNVAEDTVWRKAHSPYYVPPYMLQVQNGATLTIEPGVVVKFAKGAPYGGGMDVRGVLRAEGTSTDPIIFTSSSDDAADGIDSNQDGSMTLPAPADWMNVNFYGTTTPSMISHAQVRYGGQGRNNNPNGWYPKYTGVFGIYGARPQITDSMFDKNHAISLYMENGAHPIVMRTAIKNTIVPTHAGAGPGGFGIRIMDASSTADILGNIFENNSAGISSESATSTPLIVKDNTFTRNQQNGEFNGSNDFNVNNANNQDSERKGGFYIRLIVRAGQIKTLHADTMPYILRGGITVEEGGVLEIERGAVIKSAPNPQASPVPVIVRGTLKAHGTAERPIIFTAFADDSDGYDSDGAAVASVPGSWENIQFIGATSSASILEYVNIRYGGSGKNLCPFAYFGGPCMEYKGAVRIQGASPTISHTTFDKNLAIAAYVEGDAWPTIEYSDFRDTKQAIKNPRDTIGGIGISIGAESAPVLTDNTFMNNNEDVVYRP